MRGKAITLLRKKLNSLANRDLLPNSFSGTDDDIGWIIMQANTDIVEARTNAVRLKTEQVDAADAVGQQTERGIKGAFV